MGEAERIEDDEIGNEQTQTEAGQAGTRPMTAEPASSPRSKASCENLVLPGLYSSLDAAG